MQAGGPLIYPTETFFALGCRYDAQEAAAAIVQVKGRDASQTLPLICANREQADQLADLHQVPGELISRFWPGPLTLILFPRRTPPPGLANGQGKIALRVTSRPEAANLCRVCGPLTSSSANLHGKPPAVNAEELDPGLLAKLAGIDLPFGIFKGNFGGGADRGPSAIAEPLRYGGRWRLRLLRQGAIGQEALVSDSWELI